MSILVACSRCGQNLRAPSAALGRELPCPKCGARFEISRGEIPAARLEPMLPTIPCQPAASSEDRVSKWVWAVAGAGLCIPLVLILAIVLSPKERANTSSEPVLPVPVPNLSAEVALQDGSLRREVDELRIADVSENPPDAKKVNTEEHKSPAAEATASEPQVDRSRLVDVPKEPRAEPSPSAAPPEVNEHANERDLALLQGSWRARKVYWGPGSIEASAIDGGRISISGKEFRKQELDRNGKMVDFIATIQRIDATRQPKELDLLVESGKYNGDTFRLVYVVSDASFEFFRPPAGELPPKNPWYFGRSGPFHFEDKGNLYQYARAR